jgi:hypothetical protein
MVPFAMGAVAMATGVAVSSAIQAGIDAIMGRVLFHVATDIGSGQVQRISVPRVDPVYTRIELIRLLNLTLDLGDNDFVFDAMAMKRDGVKIILTPLETLRLDESVTIYGFCGGDLHHHQSFYQDNSLLMVNLGHIDEYSASASPSVPIRPDKDDDTEYWQTRFHEVDKGLAVANSQLFAAYSKITNVQAELAATRNKLSAVNSKLSDMTVELALAKYGLPAATSQLTDIKDIKAEIAATKNKLLADNWLARFHEADKDLAVTKFKLSAATSQLTDMKAELAAIEKKLLAANSELSVMTFKRAMARATNESHASAMSELTQMAIELATIKATREAKSKLSDARQENAVLKEQLKRFNSDNNKDQ